LKNLEPKQLILYKNIVFPYKKGFIIPFSLTKIKLVYPSVKLTGEEIFKVPDIPEPAKPTQLPKNTKDLIQIYKNICVLNKKSKP